MPRVASYNCQQSHARALDFLTKVAVKAGAEVACTQESGTRMALQSYIADTPNLAASEGYVNDPCVVVTTTTSRVQKSEGLQIRAGANENRSALLVKLRDGTVVVNVHLTSGNEKRSKPELAVIYNYLVKNYSNASWLIIGDFNHDPRADYPNLNIAAGAIHQGGSYLDWAMSNVAITSTDLPRYYGADHGPWYVDL